MDTRSIRDFQMLVDIFSSSKLRSRASRCSRSNDSLSGPMSCKRRRTNGSQAASMSKSATDSSLLELSSSSHRARKKATSMSALLGVAVLPIDERASRHGRTPWAWTWEGRENPKRVVGAGLSCAPCGRWPWARAWLLHENPLPVVWLTAHSQHQSTVSRTVLEYQQSLASELTKEV